MKYYLIAGEASGDLHASALMRELRALDPAADFRCWGGDMMAAEGGKLVKHYRELAFMGFLEVALNITTIMANLRLCRQDMLDYGPDALILIDYPGFNLRIAEFAHKQGFKVFYYISPQIWAWKKSRVHQIRRTVDRMFVILPFEKEFYAGYGIEVEFVGHPLMDVVAAAVTGSGEGKTAAGERPVVALLPGSRKQEIRRILPYMASMADKFPDYQFIIAGAPSVEPRFYQGILGTRDIRIIFGRTYELLRQAHAALVTSGTATLEAALFNVPQVVCYKGGAISYFIARRLVDVKYISLVNLIAGRAVVKELIQGDLNSRNLQLELSGILDGPEREKLLDGYRKLKGMLGTTGAAGKVAAGIIRRIS